MVVTLSGCGGSGGDADSGTDSGTGSGTDSGTDSGATGQTGTDDTDDTDGTDSETGPSGPTQTVLPVEIDDVFANPNMGFANFHFGWWCNLPPVSFTPAECATRVNDNWPENHPDTGTAYFRWHWKDIEAVRGEIDFEMIDTALQSANELGQTLGFRIMAVQEGGNGVPDWLLAPPYSASGQWAASSGGTTFFADPRDPNFQAEHARLLEALGDRYDDHPAVDHIDIGTVGCWGEWNTACLDGGGGIVDAWNPQDAGETQAIVDGLEGIIDDHLTAFPNTPVVMLGMGESGGDELDLMLHATSQGAGWRVDCWGDWGVFGPSWNHHEDLYPQVVANATAADPTFADVWQTAPVQLEVCATMPDWFDMGWTTDSPGGEVHKTFEFALDQHAALLNAKYSDIPASYGPAIDDLLRQNGYRLVIESVTWPESMAAGDSMQVLTDWNNKGVAPMYSRRALTWRLRQGAVTHELSSSEDPRSWLPGPFQTDDALTLPASLETGTWFLDVAMLDRAGSDPTTLPLPPLNLAIEGRGADGWTEIGSLAVE